MGEGFAYAQGRNSNDARQWSKARATSSFFFGSTGSQKMLRATSDKGIAALCAVRLPSLHVQNIAMRGMCCDGLRPIFFRLNEAECLHALANPSIVVCASLPIILVTLFPCVRCCTHRTHTSLHQLLWSKPTARRRACPMVASAEWQVNNSWSCIVWCRSVQTMVVHVIVLAHRLPWLLIFSGIAAYFEYAQVQALVAQPTSGM